jgi:hypothetical protein
MKVLGLRWGEVVMIIMMMVVEMLTLSQVVII